jgi:hypothetical protein
MDPKHRLTDLKVETDAHRVQFLTLEVDLGMTFVAMVKSRRAIGEREAAERLRASAELAYTTINRFLPEVVGVNDRDSIARGAQMLRSALDDLGDG